MKKGNLEEQFQQNGFCIVRNVLSLNEVKELRFLLARYWKLTREKNPIKNLSVRTLSPSEVWANSSFFLLPLREKIVSALKEALGENYCMLPDLEIHRALFAFPGWHFDAGSEGIKTYFQDTDYRFIKCGLYFQDNTEAWGGGIKLVPGSHRWLPKQAPINWAFKWKAFRWRLFSALKITPFVPDIKAGDFLFFHSLLNHSSTWPQQIPLPTASATYQLEIPEEHTKYVLYWDACAKKKHAKLFLDNAFKRSFREELNQPIKRDPFFSDYCKMHYPEAFPDTFVKKAENEGIKLCTLDKSRAQIVEKAFMELRPLSLDTIHSQWKKALDLLSYNNTPHIEKGPKDLINRNNC